MIQTLDLSGKNYELTDNVKEYVAKKLGRLDRFLPRNARKTVKLDVVLKEVNRANGNKYECDATMTLPGKMLHATDSTMNIMAAIDIVEQKLSGQLRRYKDERTHEKGWRAKLASMRGKLS